MAVVELDEPTTLAETESIVRLRGVSRGMVGVLGAQWALLTVWCWHLYTSFDVHVDFAALSMGWWGMTHGHLNPFITVWNHTFLADHFELISVPLAFLSLLWPHDFWAFIVQNLFVVTGEAGGLLLVGHFASRDWWPASLPRRSAQWLALELFVLNPWIFWAASEDVHFHAIGLAAAAVLVLYFALTERWLLLVASTVLFLSCCDLAGPSMLGIALAVALIRWRRWSGRLTAAALAVTGLAWIKFVARMGGTKGSNLRSHFGYLLGKSAKKATSLSVVKAIVTHPALAGIHLYHSLGSLWGYVSAGGILGVASPVAAPAWLAMAEGGLGRAAGLTFGTISMSPWQMIGATFFLGPASVISLAWLMGRPRRMGDWLVRHRRAIAGALLVNALVWSAVWVPAEVRNMDLTPPSAVAALDHVVTMIPHDNEVVASWGVLGRFGERRYLHTFPIKLRLAETLRIKLNTKHVDFVFTPWTGLEHEGPNPLGVLAALVRDPRAVVLYHRARVWLIEYTRRPGQSTVKLNVSFADLPGRILTPPQGTPPQYGWPGPDCLYSDSPQAGYLESRLTQHLKVGNYELTMDVASQTELVAEVIDGDTNMLLARTYNSVLPGRHVITVPFTVTSANLHHEPLFKGWFPYSFAQLPPLPQDTLDIRLWSPGGAPRAVCSASLYQLGTGATTSGSTPAG